MSDIISDMAGVGIYLLECAAAVLALMVFVAGFLAIVIGGVYIFGTAVQFYIDLF